MRRNTLVALVAVLAIASVGVVAAQGTQPAADQFEPNDDFENATQVDRGTYDNLSIHEEDDTDYYAVEASQGDDLNVSAQFDHGDADVDLRLYAPNQTQVGSSASVTDDEVINHTANTDGTYYVQVRSFLSGSASYDMSVRPVPSSSGPLGLPVGALPVLFAALIAFGVARRLR
ncbi:hypothetical protein BRD17_01925 [Halobacteriales archaeon SW_7_68_16]|nr:MAG: hypothetical protein BRD17_01925 [Halobacteriales archaeon SW_7_68_16]